MASKQTDELYRVLLDRGYPKEFCAEIAYKYMNTEYTATRMLGYLYRVSDPRLEDLVDEMLAILSDRDAIIRKKEMEHAQAVINDIYRNGLQTGHILFSCTQTTNRIQFRNHILTKGCINLTYMIRSLSRLKQSNGFSLF